jgi:FkbM family methyltransferase
MDRVLDAMVARGHRVGTVIDVGASDGRWSALAMTRFPASRYLLIEAKAEHAPALAALAAANANVDYTIAVAGDRAGSAYFRSSRLLGGRASLERGAGDATEIPMVTIDQEAASKALAGPFLLKLDTHGFERAILAGTAETLRDTELIVMECYNYRIAEDSLLFFEMCELLLDLGFRCIDLASPRYRPYDDSFWQVDLVFARSDRPGFSYPQFR